MPKQFYQIGKIQMLVTYNRYNITESGSFELKHTQTLAHDGYLTMDELKALAQERIAPGEEIEVVEAEDHTK